MCFNIFNKHAVATILKPVIYPKEVHIKTPFLIIYSVKNTGKVAGDIWAHLMVDGKELPKSRWNKTLPVNGIITASYTHPGITKDTNFLLEVGY